MSTYKFNGNIKKPDVGGLKSCLGSGLKKIKKFLYSEVQTPYDDKVLQTSLEDIQNYFLSLDWPGGIYPYEIKKAVPVTDDDGNIISYTRLTIPMPVQSAGIFECFVLRGGTGYSLSTTVQFPDPEDSEGVRASGEIVFGLSKESFILENGGLGYLEKDSIYIEDNDENLLCVLSVDSVSGSGSIVDYSLLLSTDITTAPSGIVISSTSNNRSASFSFVDNKYSIDFINITNPGSGYLVYDDETKAFMERSLILDNHGGGSGALISISQLQRLKKIYDTDDDNKIDLFTAHNLFKRSNVFTKDKYGNLQPSLDMYDRAFK